jgi:transcriptional regulator with XRE-family HTH domain
MTVGEKIQSLRKSKKLSQEELAGQLFVSRQTISQWEKDQTLPSIENLIRLKEIFGVSLDELLTDEPTRLSLSESEAQESAASLPEEPCERHVFRATPEEIKTYIQDTARLNRRAPLPAIVLILGVIVLCFLLPDLSELATFFTGVFFLVIVILVFSRKQAQKALQEAEKRLTQREYHYRIYPDRMEVDVHSQGGDDSTYVIPYEQISSVTYHKTFYLPVHNDRSFILRKADLAPDSILHQILPAKINPKTKPLKDRLRGRGLLILLLLSIASVIAATAVASELDLADTHSWVFYFFLPIPLASIVLGFLFRKKSPDAVATIITGFVTALILALVGSFCFISFDFGYDLTSVEERVGVDFPIPLETDVIAGHSYTEVGGKTEISYAIVNVTFSEEDSTGLEESISGDDRWIDTLPTAYFDLFVNRCNVSTAEYFLIYNEDLQIYNTLPTEAGTYRYILLLYDADSDLLQVAEYPVKHGTESAPRPEAP